ncbi:ATP-binding cassette sub- B member 6, mitochondrial [Mortierella alpina]|nr:ATP-binding cassette sub- B member 6, mitochondrial [Mortierella alpina]
MIASSLTPMALGRTEIGLSMILLSYTAIYTYYRHIYLRNAAYKEESSSLNDPLQKKPIETAIPIQDPKSDREPSFLDQCLARLQQAVSFISVLDLCLIYYQHSRTINNSTFAAPIVYHTTLCGVFAWNWNRLQFDAKATPGGSRWFNHLPGWIAVVGATLRAKPFFVHGLQLIGSGALFDEDSEMDLAQIFALVPGVHERVQLGLFAIRYALLWVMGILSMVHLMGLLDMGDLKVPATFLNPFTDTFLSADGEEPTTLSATTREDLKEMEEEEKAEAAAFQGFWTKAKLAITMSYPAGQTRLQILIAIQIFFITVERYLNLMVPLQTERILRSLTQDGDSSKLTSFDYGTVILYISFSYLQRYTSIVSVLRRLSQGPVDDYITQSITLRFFEHVHNLSVQDHLDFKAGEVMNVMERGVRAMQGVSKTILFRLLPTIADVAIAVVYFWVAWGWRYGLLVSVSSAVYLMITVLTGRRRSRLYRQWVEADDSSHERAVDSLTNYETVKYFTAESFEVSQYRKSYKKTSGKSLKISMVYEAMDMIDSLVWTANSLIGCLMCAYEISLGQRHVGSFMSFIVYIKQLEGPVDAMAYYVNDLRREFVSMEKLLKILEKEPTVKDVPDAEPLVVNDGEIEFENVSFRYDDNKKGLSNISFTARKGQTVAFVGATGSGKSTLLRLAFRLWDPSSGRILIDGQDIATKTQQSVRKNIGVVPQDAVLFNDTILYNINYGRVDATKEEVVAAAKLAQIHDSIMKFKDGYDTIVGERGSKLSGGEKQRLGLARTLLKGAQICLMDEPSSALDSATERQMQQALAQVSKSQTTLVVAHRLSTIMHADLILCIKDGEVVERGTHEELVQRALANGGQGEYYNMWKIQLGQGDACTAEESSATNDGSSDDESDYEE